MTLNLCRLVPIVSGALLLWLGGCEQSLLSRDLEGEELGQIASMSDMDWSGMDWSKTAAVEAATLPNPSALYNAAIALGGEAQYVADQARTLNDWKRAAMGWERALNFLRAIPPSSSMYHSAQAKIYDYEGRLQNALARLGRA